MLEDVFQTVDHLNVPSRLTPRRSGARGTRGTPSAPGRTRPGGSPPGSARRQARRPQGNSLLPLDGIGEIPICFTIVSVVVQKLSDDEV